MASEKVSFENQEGVTLSGVLESPDGKARAWALFAHCFTCSKTSLAASRISRALAARGIGTLRFDFTGLGESEGDFSETGYSNNVEDLIAAAHWMASQGRPVDLLVGHSLGGAAVISAAARLPDVKAIATLGAPAEADHVIQNFVDQIADIERSGEAEVAVAGRSFRFRKAFLDDVKQAKVLAAVSGLKRPLLIMHSPTDAVVGIDHASKLFVAAKHPKSFVSLDHADHLLTGARDAEYVADVILGWAGRYLQRNDSQDIPAPRQSHDVIVRETGTNGPFQNEIFIGGRRYLADEPEAVGGSNSGPNPYEWLSAGLGACTSMTLRMYAQRKGLALERVTVGVGHRRDHASDCVDCGPGDKVDIFTRHIKIEGDLDDATRKRLIEIADRCPVHRTLESKAVIETTEVIELAK